MSAEIVWHNSQSNETQIWLIDKNRITSRATVVDEHGNAIFVGPPFSVVGVSQGEIVWHNSQSGETQIWFMDGNRITSRATVVDEHGNAIFVGPPFSIVGVSQGEIVWHNSQSNETQIWLMDKNRITSRATVVDEHGNAIFVGPPFSVVGVSQGEIVWHNSQSGETQIWFMDGNRITSRATVVDEHGNAIFVGLPFSIVGVSQGEIVWHNSQSGETQIWFMDGNRITSRATVVDEHGNAIFVGLPFSIVGTIAAPVPPVAGFAPPVNTLFDFDAVDPENGTTQLASDLPLGGSAHLLVTNTGAFTFTMHVHDSGADNIDYSLAAVLMSQSGLAFTFGHQGGVEGTSVSLLPPFSAPRRDDNITLTGTNPTLKDEFARLDGAKFVGKLAGTDALLGGLEGFIADMVSSAAKELGASAAKAVVALVAG